MFNELTATIGKEQCKVFLQDGFYDTRRLSNRIHRHHYTEIHIVLSGRIVYRIGDAEFSAEAGTLLAIPKEELHAVVEASRDAKRIAFQLEAPLSGFESRSINRELISEFALEIESAAQGGDYSGVLAYITIFCRELVGGEGIAARHITDYGFLIYEFFSNKYSEDIRLSDLSRVLHLSARQTERLVIEHTGLCFRDALTDIRIKMARHLLSTTDISLTEVATYVGFRSYAGFWKAMRKNPEK